MKKSKVFSIICLSFMLLISSIACQPRSQEPNSPIVDDDDLAEFTEGDRDTYMPEPYEAPEQWVETMEYDKLTVEMNAEVVVPETPYYSIVHIDRLWFTQEQALEFANNTIGDVPLYVYRLHEADGTNKVYTQDGYVELRTAEEYQVLIDALDYAIDTPSSPLNTLVRPLMGDGAAQLYESKRAAYEYMLANPPQGEEYNIDETYQTEGMVRYTADLSERLHTGISAYHSQSLAYIQQCGTMDDPNITCSLATDDLYRDVPIESISGIAQEIVEKLGYGDYKLAHTGICLRNTVEELALMEAYSDMETGIFSGTYEDLDDWVKNTSYADPEDQPRSRMFIYTPEYKGVPMLYASNGICGPNDAKAFYTVPNVTIVADENGVYLTEVTNTNIVEKEILDEKVRLLPFDKVQKAFRNNISRSYEFDIPLVEGYEHLSEGLVKKTVNIDEVALGYTIIRKNGKSVLTPVWMFYGTERNLFDPNSDTQILLDENNEKPMSTPLAYTMICIDAVTGQMIRLADPLS